MFEKQKIGIKYSIKSVIEVDNLSPKAISTCLCLIKIYLLINFYFYFLNPIEHE